MSIAKQVVGVLGELPVTFGLKEVLEAIQKGARESAEARRVLDALTAHGVLTKVAPADVRVVGSLGRPRVMWSKLQGRISSDLLNKVRVSVLKLGRKFTVADILADLGVGRGYWSAVIGAIETLQRDGVVCQYLFIGADVRPGRRAACWTADPELIAEQRAAKERLDAVVHEKSALLDRLSEPFNPFGK